MNMRRNDSVLFFYETVHQHIPFLRLHTLWVSMYVACLNQEDKKLCEWLCHHFKDVKEI